MRSAPPPIRAPSGASPPRNTRSWTTSRAITTPTNRIYDTWVDGLTDGKTGSQVGYGSAPFAETTHVHGGNQSLPLKYNNTNFSSTPRPSGRSTRRWI